MERFAVDPPTTQVEGRLRKGFTAVLVGQKRVSWRQWRRVRPRKALPPPPREEGADVWSPDEAPRRASSWVVRRQLPRLASRLTLSSIFCGCPPLTAYGADASSGARGPSLARKRASNVDCPGRLQTPRSPAATRRSRNLKTVSAASGRPIASASSWAPSGTPASRSRRTASCCSATTSSAASLSIAG